MSTQGVQLKPSRERLPAQQRRIAIIEAAIDLFSSRGFRGATTRELAAATGVTEPVLYQHFATKRALYDAILESRVRQTAKTNPELDQARADGDNRRVFTCLARFLLDWYLDDPRWVRLIQFAFLERHEFSQMFFERQVCLFYEWLNPYLTHQMQQGLFRTADPALVARTFAGMIAHHGLIYSVYCPVDASPDREAIVQTVVDIFLNGMTK